MENSDGELRSSQAQTQRSRTSFESQGHSHSEDIGAEEERSEGEEEEQQQSGSHCHSSSRSRSSDPVRWVVVAKRASTPDSWVLYILATCACVCVRAFVVCRAKLA